MVQYLNNGPLAWTRNYQVHGSRFREEIEIFGGCGGLSDCHRQPNVGARLSSVATPGPRLYSSVPDLNVQIAMLIVHVSVACC
jgi:hypothetical protein